MNDYDVGDDDVDDYEDVVDDDDDVDDEDVDDDEDVVDDDGAAHQSPRLGLLPRCSA